MSNLGNPCLTVIANPDVSGIGVRTAIYAQNLLSFVPALWALKDGKVTLTELEDLEKQSTTILITAFAILISTVIQASKTGISDYHASIVLDLSWMNNTNLFIYFLLYIYHRVNLPKNEFNEEVRMLAGHAPPELRARWIYETKKALKNSVIVIGSLHLALMAAVGIRLWSDPAGFGKSGSCSLSATISIFGEEIQLGSSGLRKWSIFVYSIVLMPMMNLVIPLAFFAMPFLMFKHIFKSSGNIGLYTSATGLAILAMIDVILLQKWLSEKIHIDFIALRDLVESILEKRGKQLGDKLIDASKRGELDVAKYLLARGVRRDALGPSVWNAVIHSNANIVKVLLEYQADPNLKDSERTSLLHFAAKNGHSDVAEVLLQNKADVNWMNSDHKSPLYFASEHSHLETVHVLLIHKADANLKDRFGMSPLHLVAKNGHKNIVKLLLEHQADVNLKDRFGMSPLHLVAKNGHLDIVRFLLEHQADVNLKGRNEQSPLHLACNNDHLDIVKVLLEHQANVNLEDEDGWSSLSLQSKMAI
ncbi:hypothetical protein C0995_012817 [Termitomyces sp. Mi166|nr:hypothetical protein C0995_012817 [Termitomyces sp. Mi166\